MLEHHAERFPIVTPFHLHKNRRKDCSLRAAALMEDSHDRHRNGAALGSAFSDISGEKEEAKHDGPVPPARNHRVSGPVVKRSPVREPTYEHLWKPSSDAAGIDTRVFWHSYQAVINDRGRPVAKNLLDEDPLFSITFPLAARAPTTERTTAAWPTHQVLVDRILTVR